MINYVDKIENKLSHFSEKIIFTCRYWISLNEMTISHSIYTCKDSYMYQYSKTHYQ